MIWILLPICAAIVLVLLHANRQGELRKPYMATLHRERMVGLDADNHVVVPVKISLDPKVIIQMVVSLALIAAALWLLHSSSDPAVMTSATATIALVGGFWLKM